jgi:hypothetical protein
MYEKYENNLVKKSEKDYWLLLVIALGVWRRPMAKRVYAAPRAPGPPADGSPSGDEDALQVRNHAFVRSREVESRPSVHSRGPNQF